jgi:hypothetical protein
MKKFLFLTFILFIGIISMPSISQDLGTLGRFKNKINYPAITSKLPQDGLGVYLDWDNLLTSININGESSVAEYTSTTITHPFHAETNVRYEKDGAYINLEVHFYTGLTNKEVLDAALEMLSFTSMEDINMEYDKNGPCDVYFYSPNDIDNKIQNATCVFRNVIVRADTYSKYIDVRPVLEFLYKKMKPALVNITDFKPVIMSCTVSSEVVSIGEEFYIDVISKDESYIVELHLDFDEELDVLDIKKMRFNFKALQQGTHTISISVLDPKTLLSTNIQKSITVK